MVEMLRKMGVVTGRKESKQEELASVKPIMERSRGKNLVRVEVREEEISRNLSKLEHCLVGCWNPSLARGEDLEKLGILMAKAWGLKGKLVLARMEKGKVLLEFESLVEAKRVLSSGKRSLGGIQLCLESWSPKTGCLDEGLPISLWDLIILRRVGKSKLEELQWARILVKTNGEELPNVLEIWIEEVCYSLFLWWEIRPSLRKASFDNRGKACCSRGEVGGDAIARVGPRVVEEEEDARLERAFHISLAVVPKDFKLAGGLSLLGPLADLKSKGPAMVEAGPSSSKDEWWASEEENTLSLGLDVLEGFKPSPSRIHLEDEPNLIRPILWHSAALESWSNSNRVS
ncbi:hypothetical protein AAG906_013057 [Vitis piasezkii]